MLYVVWFGIGLRYLRILYCGVTLIYKGECMLPEALLYLATLCYGKFTLLYNALILIAEICCLTIRS